MRRFAVQRRVRAAIGPQRRRLRVPRCFSESHVGSYVRTSQCVPFLVSSLASLFLSYHEGVLPAARILTNTHCLLSRTGLGLSLAHRTLLQSRTQRTCR